ncbi:peptidoglycan recognition protein 1-like [Mercenaria mercenaria]|uniref:peptidoglycan recognition protein 1-like n=1 Tax=Mercenaria mercenaria TaxID=6596 RepID=UPI00234E6AC0|nr:peptidoglycan recognition protein 1-like [Mercenaria mercenaria]
MAPLWTCLILCAGVTLGCLSFGGGGRIAGSSIDDQEDECPDIIDRSVWHARAPKDTTRMKNIPKYVLIHHGGTPPGCTSQKECEKVIKSYQKTHMVDEGWDDIAYHFLVGEDGNVYEGRGWGVNGAHSGSTYYNLNSLGICVIGDFRNTVPNLKAQKKVKQLISCAVSENRLKSNYKLGGHRDVNKNTTCPGQSFYDLIKTWDRYYLLPHM